MSNKKIYPWVVVGLLWGVALLNYICLLYTSDAADEL